MTTPRPAGNGSLLNMLKSYDKDGINEKQIKGVKKYFGSDTPDQSLEKMKAISNAGFGLLTWVVAIVKYYEVAKNVAPLRQKVKDMEKQQRVTEGELAEIQSALAALSAQLAELNVSFEAANIELSSLQSEAALMSKRLAAASKLIDGLTGERTRWGLDVGSLEVQRVKLVGDCLLGSSFQSYLGAFTASYRKQLTYDKFLTDVMERSIPVSDPFRCILHHPLFTEDHSLTKTPALRRRVVVVWSGC